MESEPDQGGIINPDARELNQLLDEFQDLQAGATRPTRETIDELDESHRAALQDDAAENLAFHEVHQRGLGASLGVATLLSAAGATALVGALASPAFAASTMDVQLLQTAASLNDLTVATYSSALTLPYIGGAMANGVVRKFALVTRGQHMDHAAVFNAAVVAIGGRAQNKPDPAFVPVVNKAIAGRKGAIAAKGSLDVVALAIELENIAAETYVKDTVLAHGSSHKSLFESVIGVEA